VFGHFDMLKFLIDQWKGAVRYLFKQQNQPKAAIEAHIKEGISSWVNMATILDDGWTAVQLSCKYNTNNEVFLYLIDILGANVNLRNKNGASLMHKAALDDNTYAITYLRDKAGFAVDHTDYHGNTPLHFACTQAHTSAIDWLLGFGADVNA